MTIQLLPPLPIDWKMKPVSSSGKAVSQLPDGRTLLEAHHSLIEGTSPEMLAWFYRHMHTTVEYKGATIPVYRLFHPIDHVSLRLLEPATGTRNENGKGALLEIVERVLHPARIVARVLALDETTFRIAPLMRGIQVVDHSHNFTAHAGGTLDNARTIVGVTWPIVGRLVSAAMRRQALTAEYVAAYYRHVTEEVGNLQHFVPALYEQRNSATRKL